MARRRRKSKKRQQEDLVQGLVGLTLVGSFFLTYEATKSIQVSAIVTGAVLGIGIAIVIMIAIQRIERLKRSGISEIDKMDGHRFEHYLRHLFNSHGYIANVTPASGDYGADLVLSKGGNKVVVQAKRYSNNVGIKAVQEVIGAIKYYQAAEAWVVTNSDFTDAAYALAKSNEVRLINRESLIEMILAMKTKNVLQKTAEQSVQPSSAEKGEPCSQCEGEMVRRKSSKGDVYACSNYPTCKNIKFF